MVRLSADIILNSLQFTNPVGDRELCLRGYKFPVIENLGATSNQFDCIDFSDNEIRKVENFPRLPRLKILILNSNMISSFGEDLNKSLPNLTTVILTNNKISELSSIEPLSCVKTITHLSLLHNPVVAKSNYRLFIIHKFPNLRLLDFKKVKAKERDEARSTFETKDGKEQLRNIKKRAKTFIPGDKISGDLSKNDSQMLNSSGLTAVEVKQIRAAIRDASTLEEIERLNHKLRTGKTNSSLGNGEYDSMQNGNGNIIEEDDDEFADAVMDTS